MPLTDYIQLQYIESTGQEVINLNFTPSKITSNSYTCDFDAAFISFPTENASMTFCGCSWYDQNANYDYLYLFSIGRAGNLGYKIGKATAVSTSESVSTDVKYHINTYITGGNQTITITDDSGGTPITKSSILSAPSTPTQHVYLFGHNQLGTTIVPCTASVKLYGCTIKENSTTIRDLVPVKTTGSNPVVGLYDKINNTFYTNVNSTGGFTAGPPLSIEINATVNPIGSGSVTGTGTYTYQDSVTLTASPTSGSNFEFREWTLNGGYYSSDNPLTFQATQSIDLVAEFRDSSTYMVNLFKDPATSTGTLTGSGEYQAGDSATISYTNQDGRYRFKRWRDDNDPTGYIYDNPYTTTIISNLNLTAEVEKIGRCII